MFAGVCVCVCVCFVAPIIFPCDPLCIQKDERAGMKKQRKKTRKQFETD